MKKITVLLIFVIMSHYIFPQTVQIDWQNCLGGSESDYAMDILELDNGFFILGNTFSNDGDISSNHGVNDLWLVRIDSTGSILWEKCYGGSEGDGSHRIFKNNENDFFILGGAVSSDGDISNDPYPNSLDFWILKIDIDGNIIWEKIVGGNGGDHLWTGTLTNDGGVVAIGYSGSEYGDVSINYGLYDMWMIKLSNDGEIEWDFTLGTTSQDYGQAIIQTSDGGFLVGGASTLAGGGNLDCENHGESDGVLVKLDADRNIEWQHCYGGSDYDGIIALIEINDGYVFGAYTHSNDGDVSGWHGEADFWVVKINFNGNIIWQNALGGSRSEMGKNIFQTTDGNIIAIVNTQSNDGNVSGNHTLSEYYHDIWMIKLNSDGELIYQQCIGGEGNEIIEFGVVKKSDNNFVIAGQTNWGPSYDVQCTPHGGISDRDFWVFEIEDTSTNVIGQIVSESGIKVYPNPAGDYVVFELPTPTNKNDVIQSSTVIPTAGRNPPANGSTQKQGDSSLHFGMTGADEPEVVIVNVFGQTIATLPVKAEKTVWDTRTVTNGIYFYRVEIERKVVSGKIVIQK